MGNKLSGAWQRDKRNAKYVEGAERSLVQNNTKTNLEREKERETDDFTEDGTG
jgi:hypothetical protein